jgi:transketolase
MINTNELARQIRLSTLNMIYKTKSSHIGGNFSVTDILAILYSKVLNYNPNNPNDPERDRLFFSKGHCCASLYSTLSLVGYFDKQLLENYAQDGSNFLSHVSHKITGVEFSSGSLGHILPVATGQALSAKLNKKSRKIFCIISDGELNEGSNWESIMLSPHLNLDNLILIVDYNKIQSLGFIDDVIKLEPIALKFKSFGWEVVETNGHDLQQLEEAFKISNNINKKPKIIIAHTIKGKGVSFMENKVKWHYQSPSLEEYQISINELKLQL